MICGRSSELTWCRADGAATRLTPKQIVEAVDAQLQRLGTDYIDLLQFHWPDRNYHVPQYGAPLRDSSLAPDATSIAEQLQAIAGLIQAGKVRYFGLSNETPYGVTSFVKEAEYRSLPRPVALQNRLNLLEGHNELDMGLREACAPENGNLAFIAYSPLAGSAHFRIFLVKVTQFCLMELHVLGTVLQVEL
jgi:aryl-alcohol dehydrogenase-like predicted oxidoreductase